MFNEYKDTDPSSYSQLDFPFLFYIFVLCFGELYVCFILSMTSYIFEFGLGNHNFSSQDTWLIIYSIYSNKESN